MVSGENARQTRIIDRSMSYYTGFILCILNCDFKFGMFINYFVGYKIKLNMFHLTRNNTNIVSSKINSESLKKLTC